MPCKGATHLHRFTLPSLLSRSAVMRVTAVLLTVLCAVLTVGAGCDPPLLSCVRLCVRGLGSLSYATHKRVAFSWLCYAFMLYASRRSCNEMSSVPLSSFSNHCPLAGFDTTAMKSAKLRALQFGQLHARFSIVFTTFRFRVQARHYYIVRVLSTLIFTNGVRCSRERRRCCRRCRTDRMLWECCR